MPSPGFVASQSSFPSEPGRQPATTLTPFPDGPRHTAVPIPPMPPLTKAMRRLTGSPASREGSAPVRAIVAAVALVMVRLPLDQVRHAPRGRDVTAGGYAARCLT